MTNLSFKDVKPSDWYYEYVMNMTKAGLMKGYSDGTFRPDRTISRAESAAVMSRLLDSLPGIRMAKSVMPQITIIHHSIPGVGVGRGSGVWVAPWKVVTNAHVVAYEGETHDVGVFGYEGDGVSVEDGHGFSPLDPMTATVEAIDHSKDLALLNVQKPAYGDAITINTVTFGSGVNRAERVWAIGIPLGMPWDVSDGIIRHTTRRINYWEQDQVVYAMTVPINPGNSGGGLYNIWGEYVGVPSAGAMGYNSLTFAVPIYQVKSFLREAGYEA